MTVSSADYIKQNKDFWEKGYDAPNVESWVFRPYGVILKPEFGLTGAAGERHVDFGCGQGATVAFFADKGFDSVGVDVSERDITIARGRYPAMTERFQVVAGDPASVPFYGFENDVALVTAIQALYYFDDDDLDRCLMRLHAAMRPGGVIFAIMMSYDSPKYAGNATPAGGGLSRVDFAYQRIAIAAYYINMTRDEAHLKAKFHMFEPRHIGFYAEQYRSDEPYSKHFTFCGVKA